MYIHLLYCQSGVGYKQVTTESGQGAQVVILSTCPTHTDLLVVGRLQSFRLLPLTRALR